MDKHRELKALATKRQRARRDQWEGYDAGGRDNRIYCRFRTGPCLYPSKEAQDQKLEFLLDWVREYESRTDEYSLARHRELFEGFRGPKVELSSLPT
jgi:hypothetical protein